MPIAVHILPDHEAVSQTLLKRFIAFMGEHAAANLALPSGGTPVRFYALLAEAVREKRLDFSWANVFALDEFVGLAPDDPRSFRAFFAQHVFGPLGLPASQCHVLDGRAADPEAECQRYEQLIARSGGLDFALLGLGANGHLAFNEPDATLVARTHRTRLQPPGAEIAPEALTMGVGTLMHAPVVWLIASGQNKAEAVRCMLSGVVDPRCPASLLQLHPCCEIFVDQAAASLLGTERPANGNWV